MLFLMEYKIDYNCTEMQIHVHVTCGAISSFSCVRQTIYLLDILDILTYLLFLMQKCTHVTYLDVESPGLTLMNYG